MITTGSSETLPLVPAKELPERLTSLQVSRSPEKECGQGQLSFFWALVV